MNNKESGVSLNRPGYISGTKIKLIQYEIKIVNHNVIGIVIPIGFTLFDIFIRKKNEAIDQEL